jgi:hypothetical protein
MAVPFQMNRGGLQIECIQLIQQLIQFIGSGSWTDGWLWDRWMPTADHLMLGCATCIGPVGRAAPRLVLASE